MLAITQGRTFFIIAHRLSMIRDSDLILLTTIQDSDLILLTTIWGF